MIKLFIQFNKNIFYQLYELNYHFYNYKKKKFSIMFI